MDSITGRSAGWPQIDFYGVPAEASAVTIARHTTPETGDTTARPCRAHHQIPPSPDPGHSLTHRGTIVRVRRGADVEDTPTSAEGHELVAQPETPTMPVPPPSTLWRGGSPYLIVERGQRYTLGWHDTKSDGPCFVVARVGALGAKAVDRFPLTKDGWAQAWSALVQLDPGGAQAVAGKLQERITAGAARKAEQDRWAQVFEAFANAGDATVFRALGVQVLVDDGDVYTIGLQNSEAKINASRLLGPLAGAQAMVTDGSQAWSPGRAMLLPIALTGLATKTKADAAVVFPDGTVHTSPLDGNTGVREAQKQVVQFNALAGANAPAAAEAAIDPAARLWKLQELLDAGLITQDEYETKRAEIISSI